MNRSSEQARGVNVKSDDRSSDLIVDYKPAPLLLTCFSKDTEQMEKVYMYSMNEWKNKGTSEQTNE